MNRLIEFFKSEDMYDEEFFEYIKTKVHVFPSDVDLDFIGCFPKVENEKLVDIKLSVPEIKTLKNFLVNIHEYTHAYDLYKMLGKTYIENKELFEKRARYMEKKYIEKSLSGEFVEETSKKR